MKIPIPESILISKGLNISPKIKYLGIKNGTEKIFSREINLKKESFDELLGEWLNKNLAKS